MNNIKEITVFCPGDSNQISVWSNIPYLLCRELEKKEIKVNRVNIECNHTLELLFYYLIFIPLQKINKGLYYSYERTLLNRYLTYKKIKKATKFYPNTDLNLFLTFSFYNKFSSKPSLLFSDWTYEIHIKERLKREPYKIEKKYIEYERNVLSNTNLIISLFPLCAENIKNSISNKNVFHLNRNVVNNVYDYPINEEEIIKRKNDSFDLLFIGRSHYNEGLMILLNSFKRLKRDIPNLKVNIIGIENENNEEKDIKYYGFLDKGKKEDRELYYNLIINSKVVINPTPYWSGYSSIIECMFFYTPIIIYGFDDFVKEFGRNIDFGYLLNNNFENADLDKYIRKILFYDDYYTMSKNAHNAVKDYKWDLFSKDIIHLCETKL